MLLLFLLHFDEYTVNYIADTENAIDFFKNMDEYFLKICQGTL